MGGINFKCVKCGNAECDIGEIRVAGGILGKIFDVEGRVHERLLQEVQIHGIL